MVASAAAKPDLPKADRRTANGSRATEALAVAAQHRSKWAGRKSRVPPDVCRELAGIIQEPERDTLPLPALKLAVLELADK